MALLAVVDEERRVLKALRKAVESEAAPALEEALQGAMALGADFCALDEARAARKALRPSRTAIHPTTSRRSSKPASDGPFALQYEFTSRPSRN
jgi:hypothetical protein